MVGNAEGWGAALDRFLDFIEMVLEDLAGNPQTTGRSFVFSVDNLNIHNNARIVNINLNADHRLILRAPYWAVDMVWWSTFLTQFKLDQRYTLISW